MPSIRWETSRKVGEVSVELWETGTNKPVALVENMPLTAQKYKWKVGNSLEVGKTYTLKIKGMDDPTVKRGEGSGIDTPVSFSGKPKFYAVFIGVQEYEDKDIKDLTYPIYDAERLKNMLVEYYAFEDENIYFLKNPTRAEIIGNLDALTKSINAQNTDGNTNINLLVFYAGHGLFDRDMDRGFWLPKDAHHEGKGRTNWFSNNDLKDYISAIKTQHTLLIVDACFAGSVFEPETDTRGDVARGVQNIYKLKSRRAMTSGAMTTVADKSRFVEYLLKSLEEFAKDRKARYLTAGKLFYMFNELVPNVKGGGKQILSAEGIVQSRQVPVYGIIQGTGDRLGEFIFIKK